MGAMSSIFQSLSRPCCKNVNGHSVQIDRRVLSNKISKSNMIKLKRFVNTNEKVNKLSMLTFKSCIFVIRFDSNAVLIRFPEVWLVELIRTHPESKKTH